MEDTDYAMQQWLRGNESRKTIETLQIPRSAVLEFYARIDTMRSLQGQDGLARARHELAQFMVATIPYIEGLDYEFDMSHALHPVVCVKGPLVKPADGVDGVLYAKEVPPDRLFEFFEKLDGHNRGRVGRYEFWRLVEELFAVDTTLDWKIYTSPIFYGLVLKAKDEILRRAKREMQAVD